MTPVGLAFVDQTAWNQPGSVVGSFFEEIADPWSRPFRLPLGTGGRCALMTVARVKANAPRQGLLALFDQPTFDKGSLLTMPDGVTSFTALSLKPANVFETLANTVKAVNPAAGESFTQIEAMIQARSRLQLRKDLLAHLGPKVLFYIAPATAASASTTKSATDSASGA